MPQGMLKEDLVIIAIESFITQKATVLQTLPRVDVRATISGQIPVRGIIRIDTRIKLQCAIYTRVRKVKFVGSHRKLIKTEN